MIASQGLSGNIKPVSKGYLENVVDTFRLGALLYNQQTGACFYVSTCSSRNST